MRKSIPPTAPPTTAGVWSLRRAVLDEIDDGDDEEWVTMGVCGRAVGDIKSEDKAFEELAEGGDKELDAVGVCSPVVVDI